MDTHWLSNTERSLSGQQWRTRVRGDKMNKRKIDLKWAQTLDGQLCDDSGTSQWITSGSELDYTHYIRSKYQGILVGASTFLIDKAQLTVRRYKDFQGDQPVRIILDPRDRVSEALSNPSQSAMVFSMLLKGKRPTVIIGGGAEPNYPGFANNIYYVNQPIDLSIDNTRLRSDLETALAKAEKLIERDLSSILVEGGPRVLTSLANQGAFDRLFVSVAPKLTGGYKFRIEAGRNLRDSINFELIDVSVRENDVIFEYQSNKDQALERVYQ